MFAEVGSQSAHFVLHDRKVVHVSLILIPLRGDRAPRDRLIPKVEGRLLDQHHHIGGHHWTLRTIRFLDIFHRQMVGGDVVILGVVADLESGHSESLSHRLGFGLRVQSVRSRDGVRGASLVEFGIRNILNLQHRNIKQ